MADAQMQEKLEHKWQKSKLQIHLNSIRSYTLELGKRRQSFFSDITSRESNKAHTLFATVDKQFNPHPPTVYLLNWTAM